MAYNNEILGDLINRDTDVDGVLDWEEGLWGTNPAIKDTDGDGELDDVEIAKLKAESSTNGSLEGSGEISEENLTETDKFSRELFATIATLNQSGVVDETTIDKLSESIANQIQNYSQKKVFSFSEIKIINNDSTETIQKYIDTLNSIYAKYPVEDKMGNVFQKLINEENIDVSPELDPMINQMNNITNELVRMDAPQSLSLLHLNLINASQKFVENLSNMKLANTDVILAISALSRFGEDITALESAFNELLVKISQKLNN